MNNIATTMACMEAEPTAPDAAGVIVPVYFARKRVAVRLLGLLLLIIAAPVIVLLCALVRITSKGPAIFRQVRTGKDGKPYGILKLRTMYTDAEHATGPVWCSVGDSRVTPLGRVLRFLHLDELPQLINVVRGEMDLIGPRPERPEIIASEDLLDRVANYADRTWVLPGVTGLAQINLPADQTIECVHLKVALDLEYIRTASLGLDLRILACTAFRMLGVRHGIAVRFFGLDRPLPRLSEPRAEASRPLVAPVRPARRAGARKAARAPEPAPLVASLGPGYCDAFADGTSEALASSFHKRPR